MEEVDLARVRAWSHAHYQRTSTNARASPSVVGGRALEYFSVFKAGNNNIRYSLGVMTDEEIRSLGGGFDVSSTDSVSDTSGGDENTTVPATEAGLGTGTGMGTEEDDVKQPCRFTFLRDPLQRFVSGYAEFEYRQSEKFTSLDPDTCTTEDWATVYFDHSMPAAREFVKAGAWPPKIGTKERAKLLLKLITTLRWVNNTVGPAPSPLALDPWPVRQSLNCYVAFHHLFPQASNFASGLISTKTSPTGYVGGGWMEGSGSGGDRETDGDVAGGEIIEGLASSWSAPGEEGERAVFPALGRSRSSSSSSLHSNSLLTASRAVSTSRGVDVNRLEGEPGTRLDFVGKLENFQEDWKDLASTCGVEPPEALTYKEFSNGGGHEYTSADEDGTQAAMTQLLAEDEYAARAFCLLFMDDYLVGNYELPQACSGIKEEVGT